MNIATLGVVIDPKGAEDGARKVNSALGSIEGSAKKMLASITGFFAAIASLAAGVAAAFKSISAAADMETMVNQFAVLLGSFDKAKARMAELTKFAADTPFELPEIVNASKSLESLTQGALSTGKGLTLIGDAASMAGQKYDDFAIVVGRVYAAIQGGRALGNEAMRLQELGVLLPATRNKLEAMQKAGASASAMWALMEADLGRFSGAMKIQSLSWNGLFSTLKDNVQGLFREFGAPIIDQLKPLLQSAIKLASDLAPWARKAGEAVAAMIATLRGLFMNGEIGEAFGLSLELGAMKGVNALVKGFGGAFNAAGVLLSEAASLFIDNLALVTKPEFWTGVGKALLGILVDFGTRLIDVFARPIAGLQAGMEGAVDAMLRKLPKWLGGLDASAPKFNNDEAFNQYLEQIRSLVKFNKDEITKLYEGAGQDMKPLIEQRLKDYQAAAASISDAFKKGVENMGDVFTTEEWQRVQKALDVLIAGANAAGTYKPPDMSGNLPTNLAGGGDGFDNRIAKAREKFKTDDELMRDLKDEIAALRGEFQGGNMSAKEFGRRSDDLSGKTISSLSDPSAQAAKYPELLDKWRVYNQEKARIADETDRRIAAGGATMAESLKRGFNQVADRFGNTQQQMVKLADGVATSLSTNIGNALTDIATGAKSAKDAFRDMAVAILNDIAKMIIQLLVELAVRQAIKAISGFATGGQAGGSWQDNARSVSTAQPVAYATGGNVYGGRGGVDDIPAMLTAGEFVISKNAVAMYGSEFFEMLNRKKIRKFADGGMVASSQAKQSMSKPGGQAPVTVSVSVDASSRGGSRSPQDEKKDRKKGDDFGRALETAIVQVIQRERRPGGTLSDR